MNVVDVMLADFRMDLQCTRLRSQRSEFRLTFRSRLRFTFPVSQPLNDGGKDDRLETKLWTFTCEKVSQFTCCPGLIQDMFEDGDELDLPFARGKPVPTMMETLYDKGITQVDERA